MLHHYIQLFVEKYKCIETSIQKKNSIQNYYVHNTHRLSGENQCDWLSLDTWGATENLILNTWIRIPRY